MALAQEFAADELQEVKQRFFSEAESAGRLNHPNIVTMFDAGEEHDLAYIAMEFLKGKDLVAYTKPDQLLPLPQVMSIIARVADALDYAHKQNVVHRDIKPGNIMYDPETDSTKWLISALRASPIRAKPKPAWSWAPLPICRRNNWPAARSVAVLTSSPWA